MLTASGSLGRVFFILFALILIGLVIAVLNAKYGVCNPVLVQLRRMGWGSGNRGAYSVVDGSGSHNPDGPDDAQSYLNEEEFGKSAELLADGLPNKKKTKSVNNSSGGDAPISSSSSSGKGDGGLLDAAVISDEPLKPLPAGTKSDSVPTLAGPKAGGEEEFDVRGKSN